MGPSTAGGGLDPSFCTSRSEEARGRFLSPGTICPRDMAGDEASGGGGEWGGGRRMGRQVFQGEAGLRVGVEAGRPGPEDGTWRPRRARPGSLPTPVMRPGQGGQAMGRWELQRQEQLLLRC